MNNMCVCVCVCVVVTVVWLHTQSCVGSSQPFGTGHCSIPPAYTARIGSA